MCSEWNQHLFSGHLWSGFPGAYPFSPRGTPARAKVEHHCQRHERLHQADGGSDERMGTHLMREVEHLYLSFSGITLL
ncbi:MAG TPA: hypothetical protein VEL31_14060 [Ktedonobacteraceae bacterium]|nr:hypothetical protein [Ktedonobacteraceae bacterium]